MFLLVEVSSCNVYHEILTCISLLENNNNKNNTYDFPHQTLYNLTFDINISQKGKHQANIAQCDWSDARRDNYGKGHVHVLLITYTSNSTIL